MARGGLITDCDDCAWQACFTATECLRAVAAERGVEPNDILDGLAPLRTARALTAAELEQLAADLPDHGRPLTDTSVTHD